MRRIKDYNDTFLGCKLMPGKFYVLEFIDRDYGAHFLFEFDSLINRDGVITILQRNKWVFRDKLMFCDGVEALYSTDQTGEVKLSRYYKKINWDDYNQ